MKNEKITLDSIALSEYGGLIQTVSERLSGINRKSFAKELSEFLRLETITNFMKRNKIVSYIDNLLALVSDKMITSDREFSSEKLGVDKTELEIAKEITGNKELTAENAEVSLLDSGKLPTLADFISHAHEAGSGWFISFIEIEHEGKRRVAAVHAPWFDGTLSVLWHWFGPSRRWGAVRRLVLASGTK